MAIEKFFETQNAIAATKAAREKYESFLRTYLFNLSNVYLSGVTYTADSDLAELLGDNTDNFTASLENTGYTLPEDFNLEGKTINSLVTEIRIALTENVNEPETPSYNFTAGISESLVGFLATSFGSYTGTSSPTIIGLYDNTNTSEATLIKRRS